MGSQVGMRPSDRRTERMEQHSSPRWNQAIAVQSGRTKLQGRSFVDLFENVIPGAKNATNGKFYCTQSG